jgi:lysyl-tRNA synthetase class I
MFENKGIEMKILLPTRKITLNNNYYLIFNICEMTTKITQSHK